MNILVNTDTKIADMANSRYLPFYVYIGFKHYSAVCCRFELKYFKLILF